MTLYLETVKAYNTAMWRLFLEYRVRSWTRWIQYQLPVCCGNARVIRYGSTVGVGKCSWCKRPSMFMTSATASASVDLGLEQCPDHRGTNILAQRKLKWIVVFAGKISNVSKDRCEADVRVFAHIGDVEWGLNRIYKMYRVLTILK